MSESTAKACRRMIDREMAKKSRWMIDQFLKNVKSYPLKNRLRFAWQIVKG